MTPGAKGVRAAVARLGFDADRLGHAFRTALAACCALLLAWLVGLEHPQWSAMTVWATAQPLRGPFAEKSLFRFLGTVVGSVFGVLLLMVSHSETWIIVIGLSVWVGVCAGLANLLRGFIAYGAMLSGYTAAMVTLLQSPGGGSGLAIGIDRMLTVLAGVVVALALGWFFTDAADGDGLKRRVVELTRRVLRNLAQHLGAEGGSSAVERQRLLAEMAAVEEGLEAHAAGSLRSRASVRAVRRLLAAEVAVLLWIRRSPAAQEGAGELRACLEEAAAGLSGNRFPEGAAAALRRAAAMAEGDPALREALAGLSDALEGLRDVAGGAQPAEAVPHQVVLHRDWVGAREAMFRTGGVTLAVGLLWLATGTGMGGFMMLGTAIMTTVFSTADNPVQTMRFVLLGQIAGAAGALACRWLVWPMVGGEMGLVLSLMPFVLLGAPVMAHRRTATIGFDYNMVLLLMMQPAWPLRMGFVTSLSAAVAVILGPLIALVAYRFVFPVSGRRRRETLVAMMVHEIESMAAQSGAARFRKVWRARLYHRVLRLVRAAEKTGGSTERVVEGSFALLLLGSAVLHMDALQRQDGLSPALARRLAATRARLRRVGSDPMRAARALSGTARRLGGVAGAEPALLREAAAELAGQGDFFKAA